MMKEGGRAEDCFNIGLSPHIASSTSTSAKQIAGGSAISLDANRQ